MARIACYQDRYHLEFSNEKTNGGWRITLANFPFGYVQEEFNKRIQDPRYAGNDYRITQVVLEHYSLESQEAEATA